MGVLLAWIRVGTYLSTIKAGSLQWVVLDAVF